MLLEIDHHSGVPIYRQIIDQVREQIMAGLLKEGEQLMPVRELSAQLSVNLMTVSKAYSAMETEGLLERRRGIGLFISNTHPSNKERSKEAAVEEHCFTEEYIDFQANCSKRVISICTAVLIAFLAEIYFPGRKYTNREPV